MGRETKDTDGIEKGLNEFFIEDDDGPAFDMQALAKLSDEEFTSKRLEDMRRYIKEHKKFTREFPKCFDCYGIIKKAEDLVIYFGASLHPNCFKKYYARERNKSKLFIKEHHKLYFDRVLKVTCGE